MMNESTDILEFHDGTTAADRVAAQQRPPRRSVREIGSEATG
jgi:hypothetical protein